MHLTQSKTNVPLVLPLNGKAMNAIDDYILTGNPECGYREIFLTVKGNVRSMSKRKSTFTSLCDKYFHAADVDKIPGWCFHSIIRTFATELSEAGVPVENISQMLGHTDIAEDKPNLSDNREQIIFCAIDFEEIPITSGI